MTEAPSWLEDRDKVVFRTGNLLTVLGVSLSLGRRNEFIPCDHFVVKFAVKELS